MIEALTEEHRAKFPEYVKKWTDIARCTDTIDKSKVREIIDLVYKHGGAEPPKDIVYADSPMAGRDVYAIVKAVDDQDYSIFLDDPYKSVEALLKDDKYAKDIRTCLDTARQKACYGQHDANWLSHHEFFRHECGLTEETEILQGLVKAAQLGWFWCLEDVAIVTDRPETLTVDADGEMHNETGPALKYRDGEAIYCWNGFTVKKHVVEAPETITIEEIRKEENAEIRRILIERYGASKFIQDTNAEVIDQDVSEHNGLRVLADIGDVDSNLLCVTCPSSGDTYFLDVPKDRLTCAEANNYLSNDKKGRQIGAT